MKHEWQVSDCARATRFYVEVFGATVVAAEHLATGRMVSAEVIVGQHRVRLVEGRGPSGAARAPWQPILLRLPLGVDRHDVLDRVVMAGGAAEFHYRDADADREFKVIVQDCAGRRWTLAES